MWWAKFLLLIFTTALVTFLIVRIDLWLKQRRANPQAQWTFRGLVYFVLNLRDLF